MGGEGGNCWWKNFFGPKFCVPAPLAPTSVLTQNKGPDTEPHFSNPPPPSAGVHVTPPPPPPQSNFQVAQKRLDRRLVEDAKAVGGGYSRLQMPLKPALRVRGTVAGHRVGTLEGGRAGVPPPPLPTHPCPPPACRRDRGFLLLSNGPIVVCMLGWPPLWCPVSWLPVLPLQGHKERLLLWGKRRGLTTGEGGGVCLPTPHPQQETDSPSPESKPPPSPDVRCPSSCRTDRPKGKTPLIAHAGQQQLGHAPFTESWVIQQQVHYSGRLSFKGGGGGEKGS